MKFDIEKNIFYYKKGSDLYFSEKYRLVFICRNFLDLYLIKIQICFYMQKNFRSIFNENRDQFCMQKNFRSVFNENTDQVFSIQKNFRFVLNENTDQFCM